MTDIFTHSLILQSMSDYVINNAKILEIGTGHGYLSYVLKKMNRALEITGIDCN